MQLLSPKISNVLISKLNNGLRVATLKGNYMFASLGLYIKTGSRNETPEFKGATHFLQHLAFPVPSSTTDPKLAELQSSLRGTTFCSSSRESMMYCGSVLHEHIPNAVDLLARSATRLDYSSEELETAQASIKFEASEAQKRPELGLSDALYQVSFGSSGLGNPMHCSATDALNMTVEKLKMFRKNEFCPENMVLVGTGMSHAMLTDISEKYFGHLLNNPKKGDASLNTVAQFQGGSARSIIPPPPPTHPNATHPLTYITVAFPSVPQTHPDLFTLHTLQLLMGGGDAFSTGGPGKGMYSRLFTHVLNWYPDVESCHAFYEPYSDTSLFGMSMSCQPKFHRNVFNVLSGELWHMCEDIEDEAFERAKTQLKSAMLMNMENQLVRLENIGQQILFRNEYMEPQEIIHLIDAVTKEDLRRVAYSFLSQPKHSCVCIGQSLDGLPEFTSTFENFRR
ncbi:Mitochondrial-processing peptidase subunit alpha [Coelomomyces lativittatus]|nr:Mitochondrial-processing peptidase subunit alpha [Coelomomyces lativittatus]KAJ1516364.1 Mitochondrial-processing peptidase subunit alpha [Coelomomyces lativittatus]KAJ1518542.1 Mitochondrial-processing peptidase subunit alpha [Coelomomyces lativittatus]